MINYLNSYKDNSNKIRNFIGILVFERKIRGIVVQLNKNKQINKCKID